MLQMPEKGFLHLQADSYFTGVSLRRSCEESQGARPSDREDSAMKASKPALEAQPPPAKSRYCLAEMPMFYRGGYFQIIHVYCGGSKYLCGLPLDAKFELLLILLDGQRQCAKCHAKFEELSQP